MEIEKKKKLAELRGWTYFQEYAQPDGPMWMGFINEHGDNVHESEFNPQEGGKDLTELLQALNNIQKITLIHRLEKKRKSIVSFAAINVINFAIWLKDDDNAEIITEAIYSVIEEEK